MVPATSSAPVVIIGAGPTGLALALGLARHGVRSTIIERKPSTSEYSKAPGIHVRTREVFRHWGVERRFLEAGTLVETLKLHDARHDRRKLLSLDFSELASEADRPGLLILEQGETERLLLAAVRETGLCKVRFDAEAVGLHQSTARVSVVARQNGEEVSLDADFVVGCDGADSFTRDALGLPFDGITYRLQPMLADVRVSDERDRLPWPRVYNGRRGFGFTVRLRKGLWRVIHLDPRHEGDDVSAEELGRLVAKLLGEGPVESVWSSRFRIHRRSAPRFRLGRVLLAGDAAHVHSPVGGMGMNAGIQDAHNLAWKLAALLRGGDVDRLLDSYDVERRTVVVESVSRYTDVLTRTFLQTPRRVRSALFWALRTALRVEPVRRRMLRRTAMIDLDYRQSPILDGADRSAGRRLPNPEIVTPEGARIRLYDLLPPGPAVIAMSSGPLDDGYGEVIRIGPGAHAEPEGLLHRLAGDDGRWILVRPDAHVSGVARDRGALEQRTADALGDGRSRLSPVGGPAAATRPHG